VIPLRCFCPSSSVKRSASLIRGLRRCPISSSDNQQPIGQVVPTSAEALLLSWSRAERRPPRLRPGPASSCSWFPGRSRCRPVFLRWVCAGLRLAVHLAAQSCRVLIVALLGGRERPLGCDWGQAGSNTEVLAHGVGEGFPADVFSHVAEHRGNQSRPGAPPPRPLRFLAAAAARRMRRRSNVKRPVFGDVEVEVGEIQQRRSSAPTPGRSVELVALENQRSPLDQLGVRCNIQAIEQGQLGISGTAGPPSLCGLGSKSCRLPSRLRCPCCRTLRLTSAKLFDDPRSPSGKTSAGNNPPELTHSRSTSAPKAGSWFLRCGRLQRSRPDRPHCPGICSSWRTLLIEG